eukprot:Lithocolla_globosa_v1_NODE_7113_length_990_cov_869.985027.p1 type:complete len:227 gc:universal NODE_7113_length_990_cov_869.985027:129-809(+)
MVVYERTDNKLEVFDKDSNKPDIQRHNIFEDGSAFILQNVLSKNECDHYISQAETLGFHGCSTKYRVTNRVSAMSENLAEVLFHRIKQHLNSIDVTFDNRDRGVPEEVRRGHYDPVNLNECFRICRYEKGGFFLPHFDYGFERSMEERSIKTFMLYLNEDFEGGPTCFYNDKQPHYEKGKKENIVHQYRPKAGDLMVFNHHITHDGGELTGGKKYIMRSEVMFKRS